MIDRLLENIIMEKFGRKKAIIILGARQTGKTTLIKNYVKKSCIENKKIRLIFAAAINNLRDYYW